MITILKNGAHVQYGINEYIADSLADMQQVPEYMDVGATIFCIENSTKYIVTTNYEFAEIEKGGGGGSSSTKFAPIYVSFADATWTEIPSNMWEGFDSSNLSSLSHMFFYNEHLTSVDAKPFKDGLPNIITANNMFYGCSDLTEIKNLNLLLNNMSQLQDANNMFNNLKALETQTKADGEYLEIKMPNLINGTGMFTSTNISNHIKLTCGNKVTMLSSAFYGINSLTDLIIEVNGSTFPSLSSLCYNDKNLINFVYKNNSQNSVNIAASNLSGTFQSCQSLEVLDLTDWRGTLSGMPSSTFNGCTNLRKLNIRNLILSKTSFYQYSNMMSGVPTDCEIIVRDADEVAWWANNYPTYTNVHTPQPVLDAMRLDEDTLGG